MERGGMPSWKFLSFGLGFSPGKKKGIDATSEVLALLVGLQSLAGIISATPTVCLSLDGEAVRIHLGEFPEMEIGLYNAFPIISG